MDAMNEALKKKIEQMRAAKGHGMLADADEPDADDMAQQDDMAPSRDQQMDGDSISPDEMELLKALSAPQGGSSPLQQKAAIHAKEKMAHAMKHRK